MTTYEIVASVIALYAAILSSILAINTFLENSKKIRIYVDYIAFYEQIQLVVNNESKRPIKIRSVSIALEHENVIETMPGNYLSEFYQVDFPVSIKPFDSVLLLSIPETEVESSHGLQIKIYDVDGKVYTKFRNRAINPKWGNVDKLD